MNKKKPVIGIMGNLLPIESGAFLGSERVYVTDAYVDSIVRAGGAPIVIPPILDKEALDIILTQVDGILLSGGYDVDPFLYGEEPKQKIGYVHRAVDDATIEVIKDSYDSGKPIFGICKGIQILNVVFGGTLHQDMSYIEGSYVKHEQNAPNFRGTHSVAVEKNSQLYKIIGGDVLVNSYHHQAINKVADGFDVVAIADDGVVEAIERRGDNFVLAVQWHPEMMSKYNQTMQALFDRFVEACYK
ncbi:gamma-glutamyl-gamma-aminobutyrate hydrolase family protein [Clostridium sp. C8-1-8]|uniref:gamma-glutamyl-gamma-aminobutyrate hydrolase family protein n=1 Tax=Clostridium sp. C8-1-8 TaxID=2698831 RepID=UPI00136D42DF|nr:gamma-glutamyl-gamma-aminobutyrate hydrolase family protein [Clostridium sp. C8-1-8]